MAESTIEKETGSVVKNTFYLSREREREPHGRYYRERRQGAGLSFLPPNRLPKGGLRRSDRKIGRLSDYSYGGDLRG